MTLRCSARCGKNASLPLAELSMSPRPTTSEEDGFQSLRSAPGALGIRVAGQPRCQESHCRQARMGREGCKQPKEGP